MSNRSKQSVILYILRQKLKCLLKMNWHQMFIAFLWVFLASCYSVALQKNIWRGIWLWDGLLFEEQLHIISSNSCGLHQHDWSGWVQDEHWGASVLLSGSALPAQWICQFTDDASTFQEGLCLQKQFHLRSWSTNMQQSSTLCESFS